MHPFRTAILATMIAATATLAAGVSVRAQTANAPSADGGETAVPAVVGAPEAIADNAGVAAADDTETAEAREADPAAPPPGDPLNPLDAAEVDLDAFRWVKRPLVVFADTPHDPAFQLQLNNLAEGADMLRERDVIVIVDTDPAARTAVRERFRPHGFSFVLVAKDGTIVLRKPIPWEVREITRAIDKLPLRREEMRRRP